MYPRIRISGSARDRGRAYGEQARERIAATQAGYEQAFSDLAGLTWRDAIQHATVFAPAIEKHAPDAMEEMKGIAQGAGIELGDILAMNARTEVIWSATSREAAVRRSELASECTSLALLSSRTVTDGPIAGQNWDWLVHCVDSAVVLEVEQPGDLPNFVTAVEAGLLAKVCLNSAGLAVLTNALVTSWDRGGPGIPYHVMLRLLANCQTVAEAVRLVQVLPRSSSANYLLVHGDDVAVNLEAAPGDYTRVRWQLPSAGALLHTNHLLDPSADSGDVSAYAMPDSVVRLARASAILGSGGAPWTPDQLATLLADHADWPASICCHPDPRESSGMRWMTVLSVIILPAERSFRIASGNPCTHPYVEIACGELLQKETLLTAAKPRTVD